MLMTFKTTPRSHEVVLGEHDLIVSKTCPKGIIHYANRKFMAISGYSEQQLLGQPHNIIRHPDMPKAVYRLMWKALQRGHEFFGFVKNSCADGSYYWVFANVTPDMDLQGQLQGYYSVRRKPNLDTIKHYIEPLYRSMLEIEARGQGSSAIDLSVAKLESWLQEIGMDYCHAMITLYQQGQLPNQEVSYAQSPQ